MMRHSIVLLSEWLCYGGVFHKLVWSFFVMEWNYNCCQSLSRRPLHPFLRLMVVEEPIMGSRFILSDIMENFDFHSSIFCTIFVFESVIRIIMYWSESSLSAGLSTFGAGTFCASTFGAWGWRAGVSWATLVQSQWLIVREISQNFKSGRCRRIHAS